ncbi:PAS domain-containing protein [Altererythrobacter soli]|uniref:histidine kinase n=1 Tax=Croceibacterium soli TaxID=1739690 RepID=A0A6I4UVL8_9SPHN|nr:PAS domain-containing sensor histidine kinase [Croceibacterium soli]MXP42821.1 PAS domain-containing protein [Croceibacterium soli]
MSEAVPTEDLADLYDNAPCGYLSLSPDGRIVKINRTLADWLGRRGDELLGRSIHQILSFGGKIAFETHLAPLLRLQGHVHEIALDLVDAANEKIPVIANAAERRGADGEHLFSRLTVFKAVDRRSFERSLIEARIKAEAEAKSERTALELRDQFMAVLGHDLRNPLAAIRSGLRLLGKGEGRTAREEAIIGEMNRSVDRANRLIDDVLDFARGKLGSGIPLARDRDKPLAPILEQVLVEMRAIDPDREFRARIEIAHPVDCDPDRIGQMASNLLANAATHGSPDQPIILEATTTDEAFRLSIANGGEAIPENVREHLFQPFFRGQARESKQGLGLGLFIVKEIAKAHGGTMEVTSTDEETRFTFTMPREAKG